MKFALHGGKKVEAEANIQGAVCQECDSEVIAKCGDINRHHWAHKRKNECYHYSNPETKWHRDWKNNFPLEWQEIVHTSKTGEKHIADIKTPNGLVVEFQHSPIEKDEVSTRNTFYKNIIWIVNGKRRKYDERNFGKGNSRLINQWENTGKLVFFDFGERATYLKPNRSGDYKIGSTHKKDLIWWINYVSRWGNLSGKVNQRLIDGVKYGTGIRSDKL